MKIDGTPANAAIPHQAMKKNKQDIEQLPENHPAVQNTDDLESQEKLRGVIRLLKSGHFKGVADVRLRINFYEEIQALESQHLRSTAADSFEDFDNTIQKLTADLKESGLLSPDQVLAVDAFLKNLENAKNHFMDDPSISVQTLIQNLQNELDSLLGSLNSTLAEPPVEPQATQQEQTEPVPEDKSPVQPAETAGTEESAQGIPAQPAQMPFTVEEPQPSELSPLQQLVESFQKAIDDLNSELTTTSALPPISEPSGSGKAFAKFMEMYEAMQSGIQPQNPEPELLDFEEVVIPEERDPVTEPA